MGEPEARPVPPQSAVATAAWLLDSREVARLLGISRTKTFQLMASGQLPTIRLGRSVRVPAVALFEWIGSRTEPANDIR